MKRPAKVECTLFGILDHEGQRVMPVKVYAGYVGVTRQVVYGMIKRGRVKSVVLWGNTFIVF